MHLRRLLAAFGGIAALALAPALASAQNEAPFTIRYPPDGATVREKVHVQVPLASIPQGGFVQVSINGQFRTALIPNREASAKKTANKMFDYVWDTKAPYRPTPLDKEQYQPDGPAEITMALYVPNPGPAGGSSLKSTSTVHVTVANRIATDPGPLSLRYRFIDGSSRTYDRTGSTVLISGVTQGPESSAAQELVGQTSKLQLSVDDIYSNGQAMLRNQLTQMEVRQAGQLSVYPENLLPGSLYQQVTPLGKVTYQNRSLSFEQFAALGLPITGTIDLPVLPVEPVKVGDTWKIPNQVLDVPSVTPEPAIRITGTGNVDTFAQAFQSGTAGDLLGTFATQKKPIVTLTGKLEDLEWEGGYPTAHIVESYDGTASTSGMDGLIFGDTFIAQPQITYRRDIYLAFKSGTLVKMVRKLEVTGRSPIAATTATTVGSYAPTPYRAYTPGAAAARGGTNVRFGNRHSEDDTDERATTTGMPRGPVFGGIAANPAARRNLISGRGIGNRRSGGYAGRAGAYTGTPAYRYGTGASTSYTPAPAPIPNGYGATTTSPTIGRITMRLTQTTVLQHGKSAETVMAY